MFVLRLEWSQIPGIFTDQLMGTSGYELEVAVRLRLSGSLLETTFVLILITPQTVGIGAVELLSLTL